VTVRVRNDHRRGEAAARRLGRKARRYLAALGREGAELSILVCSDAVIRRLNREWRGKDRATDVLSFPLTEPAGAGPWLGDVVVSLDTAERRARQEGRALGAELDRYLAHGLLHLLGHDHERPRDAARMSAAEEGLLRGEGMVGAAEGEARPRGSGPRAPRSPAR
jgi:probable rRNA maturation factor